MRSIAAYLIALFAIMGMAAATVYDVEIITPHDGDEFSLGDTVSVKSEMFGSNEGYMIGRMFINGERVRTSNWVPARAGEYTIMVEAADNFEFKNPVRDTVTIIVQ